MGVFMFLLMFVLAPVVGLISTFGLGIEPWPVGIVVALLGFGGLLRIIYALMFESKVPHALPDVAETGRLHPASANFTTSALPSQSEPSAADYASPAVGWRDAETVGPASVTDRTTRLLEKDPDPEL